MNAPLTSSSQAALANVTLEDKYTQAKGRAFMSGVQALVRLPMLQQVRDAAARRIRAEMRKRYPSEGSAAPADIVIDANGNPIR